MRWIAVSALLISLAVPTIAQDCVDYGQYLHWVASTVAGISDISTTEVAIDGSLAYAIDGRHALTIYDCHDPAAPELIGDFTGDDGIHDGALAIVDGYALLAETGGALKVIDVRSPASPELVHDEILASSLGAIRIRGDTAYVAAGSEGAVILDLSNPSAPYWTTRVSTGHHTTGVDGNGTQLYMADGAGGLRIVDVSNPAKTLTLGSYLPDNEVHDVVVNGHIAYLAVRSVGLLVVDVSDPMSPLTVARLSFDYDRGGIEYKDGYIYIATSSETLAAVDVRNPAAPRIAGLMHARGILGAALGDGWVAWAAGRYGLQIAEAMRPESPPAVGEFMSAAPVLDLDVKEDTAYLAIGDQGVEVVDISDPHSPVGGVITSTPGSSQALVVDGSYLYVAYHDGLLIADLSQPAFPQTLSILPLSTDVRDIAVEGQRAYITGSRWDLYVVDISDPSAPFSLGKPQVGDWPRDIEVHDDIAYVLVEQFGELATYDVSDPTTVRRLGWFSPPSAIETGFAVEGSLAFVTVARYENLEGFPPQGLVIGDLSDLTRPVQLSRVALPSMPMDVVVHRSVAYVETRNGGVYVFDVRDPSNPSLLGSTYAPGDGRSLLVSNDLVLVGDGSAGLYILPTQCPMAVPVLINSSRYWFEDSVANLEWTLSTSAELPELRLHAVQGGLHRPVELNLSWAGVVRAEDDLSAEIEGAIVTYTLEDLDTGTQWSLLAALELTVPRRRGRFLLQDAVPNPFNPQTMISYSIPVAGHVELEIYDLAGRHVRTVVSGVIEAGEHRVHWDGTDDAGEKIASGVYFYRLRAGGLVETKSLALLK